MQKTISCVILISLLVGCASVKHYPNTVSKNVTINLKADTVSGFFSSLEVSAGVNDLIKSCGIDYKGFISLKPGKNKLGLKPGVTTYLAIDILEKSFRQSSTFQRGTLITPKKGRQYEVILEYVDEMFDLRVYEIRKHKRKKIQIMPFPACSSGK